MPRAIKILVCLECLDPDERLMVPARYRRTYMDLHARKKDGHTPESLREIGPRANWQDGSQEWTHGRGRHAPVVWKLVEARI